MEKSSTEHPQIASWGTDGSAIVIRDQVRFVALFAEPEYFRPCTATWGAIHKQLNQYGFEEVCTSRAISDLIAFPGDAHTSTDTRADNADDIPDTVGEKPCAPNDDVLETDNALNLSLSSIRVFRFYRGAFRKGDEQSARDIRRWPGADGSTRVKDQNEVNKAALETLKAKNDALQNKVDQLEGVVNELRGEMSSNFKELKNMLLRAAGESRMNDAPSRSNTLPLDDHDFSPLDDLLA